MRIGTLLLGIILIVGAVFGYSFSADKVSQCQSLAGEAAQFLSPEADQNCKTFRLIQFGSYGAAAIGALLVIIGLIGSGFKKVVIKDEEGSENEVKSSGGSKWLRFGFAGILLVGGAVFLMQYVFWSPQLVSDAQGNIQEMEAQKLQVSKIEAENAVRKTEYFQDLERQYSSAKAEAIELNSSVLDDPEGSAKAFIEAMRDVPDFDVEPSYVVSVYNRKQTEGRIYQVSATGEIMGWTDAEKFNRKVRKGTETQDLDRSTQLESTDK